MPSELPPLALLAGGMATRMYPLTESMPKSLLPIDGEPFLAHQLRLLVTQGIRDIIICCGHLGKQIAAFAGDGSKFGCHICYSYDGETLLGTGGALRHALPLLGQSFFVMYGDSYLSLEPEQIWKTFLTSGMPALTTVFRNNSQWETSNIEMHGGQIVCYDKRAPYPAMQYIDYGLSLMRPEALVSWPAETPFDLASVLTELAANGKLAAYEVFARFYEIGSPDGYQQTERMLAGRRQLQKSTESIQ